MCYVLCAYEPWEYNPYHPKTLLEIQVFDFFASFWWAPAISALYKWPVRAFIFIIPSISAVRSAHRFFVTSPKYSESPTLTPTNPTPPSKKQWVHEMWSAISDIAIGFSTSVSVHPTPYVSTFWLMRSNLTYTSTTCFPTLFSLHSVESTMCHVSYHPVSSYWQYRV